MAEDAGSIPAASTNLIMKVAFRNFFRNRTVNLTMKSVRYFLPEAEFYCFSFFKESKEEYDDEEPLSPNIRSIFLKTQHVSTNGIDCTDSLDNDDESTSGKGDEGNGFIFCEGYNSIFDSFRESGDKILILAEDHFFTNGKVLKELSDNDFDVALAPWDHLGFNGSILCFKPSNVSHLFPITDHGGMIEYAMERNFVQKIPSEKIYFIKNRDQVDYCGDGFYTNSSTKTEKAVKALLENGPYDAWRCNFQSEKDDTFVLEGKTFTTGANGIVCVTDSGK